MSVVVVSLPGRLPGEPNDGIADINIRINILFEWIKVVLWIGIGGRPHRTARNIREGSDNRIGLVWDLAILWM